MKKIILFCLFFALSLPFWGQNTKKMNAIKMDPQYLHSEATMDSAQEAFEMAKSLLLISSKEYLDSEKISRSSEELTKILDQKQDSLLIPRADMFKVFLYVKKADVAASAEEIVQPAGENSEQPVSQPAPAYTVQPAAAEVSAHVPQAQPAVQSSPSPSANASLKLSTAWKQDVIDNLLKASSFDEAKARLNRYKAEFKIKKIGPVGTAKDISSVFLLIGVENSSVTVLGPDEGGRTDFRSLTKVNSLPEGSQKAAWFIFAK